MNPSIKHGIERLVLHGVEISLDHFPEEVQEEGGKRKSYFRDSNKLISFQNGVLSVLLWLMLNQSWTGHTVIIPAGRRKNDEENFKNATISP